MSSNDDERNDSHETIRRRSVLAGAGTLALGRVVGTASADSREDEIVFDGLVHRALGGATLSIEADSLVISDLGEEGDSGVAVEVEGAESWLAQLAETSNSGMPVDSRILTEAYDVEGRISGAVRFTWRDSATAIAPAFRSEDVGAQVDGGWNPEDVGTSTYYKPLPWMVPVYARDIDIKADEYNRADHWYGHLHDPYDHMGWGVENRDDGGVHRQFEFGTVDTTTVRVDDEEASGEQFSFTELSEGGAEPLSEVHLRAVGTEEIVLGGESAGE